MLVTVILSALLLRGLGGSDLQVFGKAVHSGKTLLSSSDGTHSARKQPHQEAKSKIHRSLDLESFNVHVAPTTSKFSHPTIVRFYPPTVKPLHLHANMPLRFGRESDPDDERTPNSSPNLPQRFGRSREVTRVCAECPSVRRAPNQVLPQRFGRNSPYWRLLRTVASQQLLNTGLHWAEDFDLTTSSEEEVELEEKNRKE
uniref:Pro-FMRFamide-related neuropeptide VF n=1 Tax=Amphilophus citrinellus TaxID=61819 RepID=A0A3Q0QYX8_AMPCI